MSFVKQAAAAAGLAVIATLATGVIAFLNEVHLEVSFDKLKDFKVTDLASYTALGTALRIELETASDQDFVAHWVDDDGGKSVVRRSRISYKNFRLNNRISGNMTDDDKAVYAITGYYNSEKLVLAHRGQQGGTGVYTLELVQLNGTTANVFAGYQIMEDQVAPNSTNFQIVQCPFIMMDEAFASEKFPSIESARKTFPFLDNACRPFALPINITTSEATK